MAGNARVLPSGRVLVTLNGPSSCGAAVYADRTADFSSSFKRRNDNRARPTGEGERRRLRRACLRWRENRHPPKRSQAPRPDSYLKVYVPRPLRAHGYNRAMACNYEGSALTRGRYPTTFLYCSMALYRMGQNHARAHTLAIRLPSDCSRKLTLGNLRQALGRAS